MTGRRKAIIIHSPHSGRATSLSQAIASLKEAGLEIVQICSIAELDHLPPQGKLWREQGIEIAIAAGGDGLVGGVSSHIGAEGPILGILPLGTANDIARSLSIPQDLSQAVDVLMHGIEREVDLGLAHPAEQAPHNESPEGEHAYPHPASSRDHSYFVHVLTVGLNVQFARLATSATRRQRFGRLTYPLSALEAFTSREPLEVQLDFDGLAYPAGRLSQAEGEPAAPFCGQALQVTVINAPIFGGRWNLSLPEVQIDDGLLDIIVLQAVEWREVSAALVQLFASKELPTYEQEAHPLVISHPADLRTIPGIHHFQARGVTIKTSADPRDVTLDGEVRGLTPLYAHIASERLRVLTLAGFESAR